MNVLNVTLVAIAAMAGVAVVSLPLIAALSGLAAWQAIPREVYAREQQSLLRLRPTVFWVVLGVVGSVARACEWVHWANAERLLDGFNTAMLGAVLIAHFIWAFRLLRRTAGVDIRLRRFARYVAWGAAIGILVLVSGVAFAYAAA